MSDPIINLKYLSNLIDRSSLSPAEKASYLLFCQDLLNSSAPNDALNTLAALPLSQEHSSIPLVCLSYAFNKCQGQWPVFGLIRCHTKLWRALPEEAKSGRDLKSARLVATALNQVKSSYRSLTDLLPPESGKPAISEPQSGKCLTHRQLSKFLHSFSLPIRTQGNKKPIIVIALPNGPLLGLAVLAVTTFYTAAPINSSSGADQFRSDVEQTKSKTVLVVKADLQRLGLEQAWVADAGIQVLVVDEKPDLTFAVTPLAIPATSFHSERVPNGPDDLGIILFTSGTSGTKKVVPLSLHNIVSGVAFVIESWGLSEDDVCLNMMPLNHVGGLVRNLFAPILAGGSTICCPAFDPNMFWDVVEDQNPSWYYASPSMHSTILAEVKDRSNALSRSRIRLVCNAAGGLLPSLASELRKTFGCTVLPSYGMTECMPISTPPLNYQLDRPGTSGVSVGPEIAILDGHDQRLPSGEVGRIGVRGAPVFPGYLRIDRIETSIFTSDGWFDTGDMGYLDNDGYLYITGRSKEVVNRGGELISPFEVEEAIMVASRTPGSSIYNRVSEVLVFSAPHDILQEVIGIVIVTPPGGLRPDLRQLHEALKSSLHQPKWPFIVVYMDAAPKKNGKLLRIRLGERFGLEPFSDETIMAERHFEAKCPPVDTPLSEPIMISPCHIDAEAVAEVFRHRLAPAFHIYVGRGTQDGLPEVVILPQESDKASNSASDNFPLSQNGLYDLLDGYLIPSSVNYIESLVPVDKDGSINSEKLKALVNEQNSSSSIQDLSSTEDKIRTLFATVLACSPMVVSAHSDFFELGGDSLKAGRLLSMLRKEFQVRVSIATLFQRRRVEDLCEIINESLSEKITTTTAEAMPDHGQQALPGCSTTNSSTNPILLMIQLMPIGLLYPMRRALKWTFFLYILSYSTTCWPAHTSITDRFIMLLLALAFSKFAIQICSPFIALALKWLIIGRYQEGMYPMWGVYHTRWWFVQKVLAIFGKGIFGYSDYTRLLYYRLLGAKIGKGVKISKGTILGEYDLLHIGDNVELDSCTCRPFAAERNTSMYLQRIVLGKNSSVGLKSVVAPGTVLPENTCIGPNSSNWEIKDATEANRDLSSKRVPKPQPILSFLLGVPIQLLVSFFALLPWLAGLIGIILSEPGQEENMVTSVTIWFAAPKRIAFHFLARILSVSMGPFFFIGIIILVKVILDKSVGTLSPGPASTRSQMQKFRMSLMSNLLPKGDVSKITDLFGTHYEFTSVIVRALGGKVGSRVYWPGNGPTIQDFELLDIGDNVVFGSRSHIVTSDGTGSDKVVIGDNVMVADRVVILPGTTLGNNTVLGSGALTRRDTFYPASTVWVGSKEGGAVCLSATNSIASQSDGGSQRSKYGSALTPSGSSVYSEKTQASNDSVGSYRSTQELIGSRLSSPPSLPQTPFEKDFDLEKTLPSIVVSDATSSHNEPKSAMHSLFSHSAKTKTALDPNASPFGRAFYQNQASYHVVGMPIIFSYSLLTNIFTTVYWNIAPIAAIQVLAHAMQTSPLAFATTTTVRPLTIYALFLAVLIPVMAVQAVLALAIVVAAKWLLMGRRQPGKYDWDTSSYCQRWQVLLTIERLRRHCYGGQGIIALLTGTVYTTLYFRALGASIGKHCALFAGGHTSLLFTEPDLLTLGDRVSVDDASLVAHINSRGNFGLNGLSVGDRSVLRSGSRLLSGAEMAADCVLLEHTLVMAGDAVAEGGCMQGWPGEDFVGDRLRPGCAVDRAEGVVDEREAERMRARVSFQDLVRDCPA